jgi:hypothetical protein
MGNNISAAEAPADYANSLIASDRAAPIQPRRPRGLCLDGGGMRGIIEAQFIIEIEKRLGKGLY